ncbi:MAG TPA: AMP-binding protein [Gemmatimonas sp.]|uniref:AMP-binding protein n=1 Tax=Gemmatimonas sp. TaxID=1962908 RepID=UPI002ED8938E
MPSAHVDTFARDHLPPASQQPEFIFELPELQFPAQLNCATELLDRQVSDGGGDRPCLVAPGIRWTYRELQARVDRIAHVLVAEMGVVPGNRVLLRGANHPMLVACWYAVMKAGAIAVTTMPMLRAKELATMIAIGQVTHALCDAGLLEELTAAQQVAPVLRDIRCYHDASADGLEAAMARFDAPFATVNTASDDTCLLAFTSGTTGVPKATMHYHRDVVAICRCFPTHVLRATADDVFMGSPPLAFTFGLGGLVLFPMSIGASTVLLDKVSPPHLLEGIREFGATVLFTAPTSYRAMAANRDALAGTTLRKCVSAGEALPAATRALWRDVTGIELIDGIGATELLHIFIAADEAHARPGATGKPVPGYRAEVVDDAGRPVPVGVVGKLRVKGPTGCRYLRDDRQRTYVKDGWNYTGDAYAIDADGYFHYHARTDDIIISSGYNIAGPEVENVLLQHPAVAECGVAGVPDTERGQLVKAYVVLRAGYAPDGDMVKALQDFVKQSVAPYKYPRAVRFVAQLPRTSTGKLQRFRLRELDEVSTS